MGGGALGDSTQGEAIVAGMNVMQYDAMALGPQELSLGSKVLTQRIREARFPILSANVFEAGTGQLFASPYAILQAGGHKLAVVGLTRTGADDVSGFRVVDPQQALQALLPEVAGQADTVVVLTNLDYDSALSLASSVSGVDLIIAARPSYIPAQPGRAAATATWVITAEQPLPKHTGRWVGRLAATLEADGSLGQVTWKSVPLTKDIVDDPQMKQLLDGFR